jgi:plasmid stability protein
MATIQINLRDDVQQRLAVRAAESGYKDVQKYVEALIEADTEEQLADADLEELLLQRLDSGPSIEMTPEYRKQFIEDVKPRRNSSGQ